jgi:chloramphenicol O-acetyltransferase type A
MRYIDMDTWPRREHFQFWSSFNHPHWGLCANVDITAFHAFVKERGLNFTIAWVYVLTRVANAIPEFRQRIHGDQVVEFDIVHPAITVLAEEDDLFSFAFIEYMDDFHQFAPPAAELMDSVRARATLEGKPDDNWLYMSAIPWVSFTSFRHPMPLHPGDSVPRFAWGKYFEDGGRLKMPLDVQGHHALMDGLHVGRYYLRLQELLDEPESVLLPGP